MNNNEVYSNILDADEPDLIDTISLADLESIIEQGCVNTSIDDSIIDFGELSAYPNPVDDILTIKCPIPCHEMNVGLYDTQWNLIKSFIGISINMSDLSPGIYFIKAFNKESNYIEKVIKT